MQHPFHVQTRQKDLWKKLKPLLQAGKAAAIQVRQLSSDAELVHMRLGHFWACELGDANGQGSPIIYEYKKKNEYFTMANGEKYRGDQGDCLLLIRFYYERVADDANGLTFVRGKTKEGELLAVNSSELRAVQGRQELDIKLVPICMSCRLGQTGACARCGGRGLLPLRSKSARLKGHSSIASHGAAASVYYDDKQRFFLDRDVDAEIRKLCEGT